MKIIDPVDVAKVTKLDKLGLSGLANVIMDVLKLNRINETYARHYDKKGVDFIDGLFEEFGIEFDYFEEELSRIPKEGPFVVIANHPLGAIDGIILIKLISMVRPDFKVMANFLLQKVEPISDFFMPVNPFEDRKDVKSSFSGIKDSIAHIKAGHGLGIFPAGEVSSFNIEEGKIIDKEWEEGAVKLIEKLKVPVVPVYFKAKNSRLFYMISLLSSTLRTAKLPSEMIKQGGREIFIRIGRPILTKELEENQSTEELSAFLRDRTYRLANALEAERKLPSLKTKKEEVPQDIIDAVDPALIEAEIDSLRSSGALLTQSRGLEVYCANASDIPSILTEIGRLREITFREVGEGTNLPFDLDEFDQHYRHLFLWDANEKVLAGAYRLGMGADIYPEHGIKGFYMESLFKLDDEVHPVFAKSLEMGRAFIIKEYQVKPMPLFLLWKGIVHVIVRNPDKVRYLTGGVSISNKFSKYSKALMVAFVKRYFYDAEMAKYIKPRKEYRPKLGPVESHLIEKIGGDDLNKFDKYIDDIEPGNMRFPVLLKKYIKQNAKIVAFNVDPKFNNAVDGFMYIDINDLPEKTIQPVLDELETATQNIEKKGD